MNKNKGIIGIGLIIAIVLGVIVVGGGAYYLGTKKNIENNKVVENPNIENFNEKEFNPNNLPLDVKNGSLIDETNYVAPPRLCRSDTTPWIQVLSPNGGESYVLGQQIIIKWKTCNIKNARIFADIYGPSSKNWSNLTNDIDHGLDDDGEENIMIYNTIEEGQYVLRLTANISVVGQVASDESDNIFTINSGTAKNIPSLTKLQAETLVHKTWSDCTQGDCGGVAVTVSQNNSGQYVVTAIFTELDDSTSQTKRVSIASYQNGIWVLGQPTITRTCHRGHTDGSSGFTSALCI